MGRTVKIIIACGLLTTGVILLIFVGFLRGQSLDNADHWVTIVGFFASVTLGLAGLFFAWMSWRGERAGGATGAIVQENKAGRNVANTGQIGQSTMDTSLRTGRVTQRNSGENNVANTGAMFSDHLLPDESPDGS